ncbi:hypothetical protein [Egbenema bharatensis]|uniref:hypothetical protein n=1 Tax=Egbenema bharatensis TaxID=3463334 RepID=UPI003A87E054
MFSPKRIFAIALVGFVVFTTAVDLAQADETLGERMRDRIERADRNSDRPKTTGEFLDEARGDVPLDERMENIRRDSAESLKQFGQEYSIGAQETARELGERAEDAGDALTD